MKYISFILLALLALILTGCQPREKQIRLGGEAQGTYYSIIYYDAQQRNLQPQIDSILQAFDLSASLWVDSSLLRRINRNETALLDSILLPMFEQAIEMNDYSNGAFDITVGKLVNAWGFGFEHRKDMTDHIIDSLKQYTGSGSITISHDSMNRPIVTKKYAETEFDFNAIAQGYVVDLIGAFLEQQDIHNYLIDVGGEVIARGHKPNGEQWTVGIERPATNKYDQPEVETSILLEDKAVVTSGNYRKYYEKDGVKYAHTIDPATGRPVEHTLLSVSVIDDYAWRADALCTMFMVMGLEQSLRFIDDHPNDPQVQAVFFIYNQEGEYRTFATSAFEQYIKDNQSNTKYTNQ